MGQNYLANAIYTCLKTKFKNHEYAFSDRADFGNFSTKMEKYYWESNQLWLIWDFKIWR